MVQISQQEFEQYVIDMIEGRKTKTQVVKELKTDFRTLTNKIQLLITTNPELYQRYVEKFPYTPKERKDVDAVELAIEILREERTIEQIAEKTGVGRRTLGRRINTLKKSPNEQEREIYELCRIIGYNHSRCLKNSEEVEGRRARILEEYAFKRTNTNKDANIELRRQELLKIEQQYHELCATMSKTEAAKKMGYTTNRIYKLLNELYRIEIEAQAKKRDDFRKGLEVSAEELQNMQRKSAEDLPDATKVEIETSINLDDNEK